MEKRASKRDGLKMAIVWWGCSCFCCCCWSCLNIFPVLVFLTLFLLSCSFALLLYQLVKEKKKKFFPVFPLYFLVVYFFYSLKIFSVVGCRVCHFRILFLEVFFSSFFLSFVAASATHISSCVYLHDTQKKSLELLRSKKCRQTFGGPISQ